MRAPNANEKREHSRVPAEGGIAVSIVPDSGDTASERANTYLRLTRNISPGGLSFTHHEPLHTATRLKIHLALDMPRKMVTHIGEVRWTRQTASREPFEVGVQFTETAPHDRQIWSQYIEQRFSPAT